MTASMTDSDVVAAARALGFRDVAALPAGGIVTIRTVLRDAHESCPHFDSMKRLVADKNPELVRARIGGAA